MYQSKRKIFIGHANTFHDPSITIIEGNKIYAEAIERHMQCKRAIESERLWYSWRSIKTALSHLEIIPVKDAEIIWGSPWNVCRGKPCVCPSKKNRKPSMSETNVFNYDNRFDLGFCSRANTRFAPTFVLGRNYILVN